jgi:cytochrome c peroxidase
MRHCFPLATAAACLAVIIAACGSVRAEPSKSPALPSTTADYVKYAVTDLPTHFKTGQISFFNNTPASNPITNAGATLGRALFYDERLSHNNSTSCASCHQQETGFTDPAQFSEGFEGGLTGRHSMSLGNAAYYLNGRFFWDERASTLEDQVLVPIQNSVEMGSDLSQLTTELAATAFYPTLFQNAFGTTAVTPDRISKALAQFVRSMVSYNSKFDEAIEAGTPGSPDFSAFTAQELLGRDLFHGSGSCSQCHTTAAQVGDAPRNIGLDAANVDPGVSNGRFKTPSLRNVEVRGRFMHDGRFTSLEEVIDFYSTDIQFSASLDARLKDGNQARQFNFTQSEKDALVAFLKTLTDDELLTSDLFSDPFVLLEGDLNGDGLVNGADLSAWSASFGAVSAAGDADGDGDSDGSDFLSWQRNLGRSWTDLAVPPGQAPVPEPSGALLFCLGGLLMAAAAKRRFLSA